MEEVINYRNAHDMIKVTIDACPEKAAYRWILNDRGDMESIAWRDYYDVARNVSRSLLKLGMKKGDRISILSFTSFRWVLCDAGILFMGGATVGIYHSLLPEDCEYIIKHSETKLVFAENEEQLKKLMAIKKNIPKVKKVVLMNGTYTGRGKSWVLSFEEFLKLGDSVKDSDLDKKMAAVKPSDLASIVYTSGTSGTPKGVMITHDNIIFTSQLVSITMPIEESDETLLFLPLAHIFARVDIYATLISRITLTFCRSLETVVEDIRFIKPHWFPSVPRVFEKIYIRIIDGVEQKGGIAKVLFNWAMKVGYRRSDLILAKKPVPRWLAFRYNLASKMIFSKIHDALGGRVRFCVSGAAPLNRDVGRFFHAAGITILEGYGMTENTSFTNTTSLDRFRFGSVGFTPPGVKQKVAQNGEILFKGRNVMKGYYKSPKETEQTLTKDGWLHTGDIGFIDDEGFLTITGRLKDIIITSGGKNIAPSRIENLLRTSRYINQVVIIGDQRNYLTALITLNPDTVSEFARSHNIHFDDFNELNRNEVVRNIINKEIEKANEKLASYETIKRFALVPEFTLEEGLITPTLKNKRNEIAERYKKEIESLYE